MFSVFIILCRGDFLFWSRTCMFLVSWLASSFYNGEFFLIILLKKYCALWIWVSSPFILMILRFGLVIMWNRFSGCFVPGFFRFNNLFDQGIRVLYRVFSVWDSVLYLLSLRFLFKFLKFSFLYWFCFHFQFLNPFIHFLPSLVFFIDFYKGFINFLCKDLCHIHKSYANVFVSCFSHVAVLKAYWVIFLRHLGIWVWEGFNCKFWYLILSLLGGCFLFSWFLFFSLVLRRVWWLCAAS